MTVVTPDVDARATRACDPAHRPGDVPRPRPGLRRSGTRAGRPDGVPVLLGAARGTSTTSCCRRVTARSRSSPHCTSEASTGSTSCEHTAWTDRGSRRARSRARRASRSPAARSARACRRPSGWRSASACAARRRASTACVSDGELQEGQVWEAFMSRRRITASTTWSLMVDNNHMQADGATADVMDGRADTREARGLRVRRATARRKLDRGGAGRVRLGEEQRGRPAGLVCENVPGQGCPELRGVREGALHPCRRRGLGEGVGGAALRRRPELCARDVTGPPT